MDKAFLVSEGHISGPLKFGTFDWIKKNDKTLGHLSTTHDINDIHCIHLHIWSSFNLHVSDSIQSKYITGQKCFFFFQLIDVKRKKTFIAIFSRITLVQKMSL